MQGQADRYIPSQAPLVEFYKGLVIGSINGALTNWIAVSKYHKWNSVEKFSFLASMQDMHKKAGWRAFHRGLVATMLRDGKFGIVYEMLRSHQSKKTSNAEEALIFVRNIAVATLATALSSPFNYARNMQYATPLTQAPPKIVEALNALYLDVKNHTPGKRLGHLQRQLGLGAGTLRVGLGMATSQYAFRLFQDRFSESVSETRAPRR